MAPWLQIVLTILSSVLASSGLWAFLMAKLDRNSAEREILIGIGHIELVFFGMQYIERGWVSEDEYSTLKELYEPYKKLGGNGSGTRIMEEVNKPPIRKSSFEELGGTK